MAIDMKAFIKGIDDIRETLPIVTRQLRAYYNALVDAGFSKQEALEIVKAHGIMGYLNGSGGGLGKT